MNLPIKFPDPADVIADEAARFRALSPEAQVRALGESVRLYQFLRAASGRATQLDADAARTEELGRVSVQEFVARHG